MKPPKLRTVERYAPPYPLNNFPSNFPLGLGREVVYLLATRITPRLEGADWEEIFSRLIGGRWKPSNVGLDDVLLEQTAWSAKTVKATTPSTAKRVRLISGRNSPTYSYDVDEIRKTNPNEIGEMVLGIWNARVASVRAKYENLRTVVLIKSDDLLELAIFEMNTELYQSESYNWRWNKRNNLEGLDKQTNAHCFTWQPHGSQFTLIEDIPENRLAIRLRQPPPLDRDKVLDTMEFDDSWVEIID
ncbi:MAG: hypothetical protein DRP64_19490 [Verrucomicrobia bacterium]|nr:MAG: hypothetical protein DRP64_19490 [Verrucomicrobiota bacterium]